MTSPPSAPVVTHVIIRGRVQGVGYRAWVEATAQQRGLAGWVRNRRDGAVEAVFAGAAADVAQMIAACRRGPSLARVDDIAETPGSIDLLAQRSPGASFTVLPTV